MESIKLVKKTIAKSGRSFCVYIPPTYIQNEQLDVKKKYTVIFVEEPQDQDSRKSEENAEAPA